VALTGAWPRRRLLVVALAVFAAGMALSALAPNLVMLGVGRVVGAIGAAMFTPTAAAVAAAAVAPQGRGRALALVFAGLTIAQAVGVPVGTWIAFTFGWAAAFWLSAGVSVAALVLVRMATTAVIPFQHPSLRLLLQALARPALLVAVTFTATLSAAFYIFFTYFGPLLRDKVGVGRDGITAYLLVFGAAAVVANFLGGILGDTLGPRKTLIGVALAQIVLLTALPIAPLGIVGMGVLIALWSLSSWSFMAPQQTRLVTAFPQSAPLVLALNASCLYLGIAIGSALGGLALRLGGYDALGLAGGLAGVATLLHTLAADRMIAAERR
jgi:predicted MFS family arabinose efflux permease